ncbi:MAG TPA: phosphoribosylformimino-5-aminoimidazole carboxamide ribotide isomerase [Chloroflexota bacterium]|nr:phosphoribosylformimino-5-aminoimidazole carboxamide ribotide isomerase [Chloroflexota bacterium]
MTLFRPCIDLHEGKVKQIVGGTLSDGGAGPRTNFVASQGPAYFAALYRRDNLAGGHVIKLGPGNDDAARSALAAWSGGLQLGGGVDLENASGWLDAGASKVIVTSWLFPSGVFVPERLAELSRRVGRERLVVDLSCRRVGDGWWVAINRWQTLTALPIAEPVLADLARHCSEYLVHAADVEGLCQGIDEELVAALGRWSPIPCTYAGGANDLNDLARVAALSDGRIDLTFGSALDIFGGSLVKYEDCARWNHRRSS